MDTTETKARKRYSGKFTSNGSIREDFGQPAMPRAGLARQPSSKPGVLCWALAQLEVKAD
jgi:hypothetical protein